ncbi:putative thiazole-containing bacteriocin maturation protein [Halobacillus salinarum]|uniref:Thiazole-containing bacteriocin maturation protein n=1 Tax=Halobacillus salinarum TaxID=2932257 RepID=A0ABY4EM42_9BACI|nr:putative thiazole-containing bacteriocin maturation protein [Halobacillus salinarum]UOQ45518.1 putative thiazole-containing bacteriocin maturation protein [Halobacillus salinarum]
MTNVHPSMRLKVKKGTFYMPDSNGSVYFRNNAGAFRMEGRTVHQWVEKLLPMLSGEHSVEALTDGLSPPYRTRVYEMTNALYTNGFLRDLTQDQPHELSEELLHTYASQIEYLESFGDSAAYRFQEYRKQKVLAVGKGSMVTNLVSALLQSGLPRFHVYVTHTEVTNLKRLKDIELAARTKDDNVSVEYLQKEEVNFDQLDGFDAVFYVTQEGNVEELRQLLQTCRAKKKWFVPAVFTDHQGIAGPIISPESTNCWESAMRSLHEAEDGKSLSNSPTASALLTNVIVFEWFKQSTGIKENHQTNHLYLLNPETLEGKWHPYKAHPLSSGKITAELIDNEWEEKPDKSSENWFYYFSGLTSQESGVFHHWEESALSQLPLSQCEVQTKDISANGTLHPRIIKAGMTHEQARRAAGLAGIEQYMDPLKKEMLSSLEAGSPARLHLGAGETYQEGISRAIDQLLEEHSAQEPVTKLELKNVEDRECRYYLRALTTMTGQPPELGLSENAYGFPVMWVKTQDVCAHSAGFNWTLALRKALVESLMIIQNGTAKEMKSVQFHNKMAIDIPACFEDHNLIHSVLSRLEECSVPIDLVKVTVEPFSSDGIIAIYGVLVREEAEA